MSWSQVRIGVCKPCAVRVESQSGWEEVEQKANGGKVELVTGSRARTHTHTHIRKEAAPPAGKKQPKQQ